MAIFKTSDGAEIFYNLEGEGRPVVLIHGWSADSTSFQLQRDDLKKDYQVLSYDLRGHGQSARVDYGLTMKRYAEDLRDLLGHLGLEDVLLVGWSMGTSIILEYISQFGTQGLDSICFLDMTPRLINDRDWKLGLNHGSYTMEDALRDLTTINDRWMDFAEPFIKHAVPYLEGEDLELSCQLASTNTSQVMSAMWLAMTLADYRPMLGDIDVATHIVYGEESTLYSKETAEYFRENIRDSQVIPVAGATHFLVLEKPGEICRIIRDIRK